MGQRAQFGTSRSSPTSTTASRRWPIASSRSPAPCRRARWSAGARQHGPRARARHHHQGAPGPAELHGEDGQTYILNLIDTPGHVDFSYEVTRSLAACEGALLLVDASQGVEAQTLANAYLAVDNNLEIIPVINKIDLPSAQPDEARGRSKRSSASTARARHPRQRQGRHVASKEILEAVVARCRRRRAIPDAPLKALIFDSWYDSYRGVVIVVRVIDGTIRPGMKVTLMATGQDYEVESSACSRRRRSGRRARRRRGRLPRLRHQGRRRRADRRHRHRDGAPTPEPFPGFKELKPMVFAGLYPVEGHRYAELREALEKLRLNDASFFFEPETSVALGFGFRCGFLGLLHMEIVQERLEREFNMDLVTTAPGVLYRVTTTDGEVIEIDSPAKLPEPATSTRSRSR